MWGGRTGIIYNDETIKISGLDLGRKTTLVAKEDRRPLTHAVIIKSHGHSAWSAIGETSYYPARLYCLEVEWNDSCHFTIKRLIIEWTIRRGAESRKVF